MFFRSAQQISRSTPTHHVPLLQDEHKEFGRTLTTNVKEKTNKNTVKGLWVDFCNKTTFHGFNSIYSTNYVFLQLFWIFFSVTSVIFLIFQYKLVIEKFRLKEKIINVKLEFESPPFPSVTICNLNPFKYHLAKSVEEIQDTLEEFNQQVMYSEIVKERRNKRAIASKHPQFEPVYSDCECPNGVYDECVSKDTMPPHSLNKSCICQRDRISGNAWPCRNKTVWIEALCPECNDIGYCNVPDGTGSESAACFCYLPDNSKTRGYCLLKPEGQMKRMWELKGRMSTDKSNPLVKEFMEMQQRKGAMTDQVAIATAAREKIILKMSKYSPERLGGLGYGIKDLILMGSFDGKELDIKQEFKHQADPRYGNCFTFNYDARKNKTMSRAGPSYGLRLMLFVNSSDYLPTTEGTGVRLAIHPQNEYPYPDTFGYSAPTGKISSFGISMRSVRRLNEPEGICYNSDEKLSPMQFIYKGYAYEPEGCFRSCYQRLVIERCKCADPRFPNPNRGRVEPCDSADADINKCMLDTMFIRVNNLSNFECNCTSPCHQLQYSTTYSAAKWPSESMRFECDAKENCIQYYSKHAAMIEVYYEQLSFEILNETEAYSFVNLISDFGGLFGLMLGASVVSLVELIIFLVRLVSLPVRLLMNWNKPMSTLKEEEDEQKDRNGNEYRPL